MHEIASGITFGVRVQPRAKKNAIVGELGGGIKVALTAPPVEGRANQACVEFFADLLDVPRSAVAIISGQTSRSEVVRVAGISSDTLHAKIRL